MKNRLIITFLMIAAALGLSACKTNDLEDSIAPYQKKAEIVVSNGDYQLTYRTVNKLGMKYNAFVKESGPKERFEQHESNNIDIHLPEKHFQEFMDEMRELFAADIIDENISYEKAYSSEFYKSSKDIDNLKEKIEELEFVRDNTDDLDEKMVAKYELDKSEKELERLRYKNLSYLESMNGSDVTVIWKDIDELIAAPEEAIAGMPIVENIDFPDMVDTNEAQEIKPVPNDEDIIYSDEALNKQNSDKYQTITLIFSEYGQEEIIPLGEPVRIFFSGIDKNNVNMVSEVNLKDSTIKLKAMPKKSYTNPKKK